MSTTPFNCAIQKFDRENQNDPNSESYNGQEHPKELLYAQRMTQWLVKVAPEASEELQLAARSQHICRWIIPRDTYPMDRKGYLRWRTELRKFHAEKAAQIMEDCGYGQQSIEHVKLLIQKQRMKTDLESQTLEDVVCLVFLEYYFEDFASKHGTEKVLSIVKKTWNKMSEGGQQLIQTIELSDTSRAILQKALSES
jgi:hypothetical protein